MLHSLSPRTRWYHIIFALLLMAAVGCTAQGNFSSNREPQEGDEDLSRQAVEVTMQELDAAPLAFVNRFIRVSGEFRPPAEPLCDEVRGPAPRWALVNGELHLQATGFNTILSLVPEGTMLTVEGWWRLYEGPAGCGKEPSPETIWYLEAMQIVEPNPLPQFDLLAAEEPALQEEEGTETRTPTPTATEGTPTPTATGGTPTMTPTVDPLLTPSPSPTPSLTPTPSATPEEETTATPSPQETPEPSPTIGNGSTPTASAPTAPPDDGGYPPPAPTETPPGY